MVDHFKVARYRTRRGLILKVLIKHYPSSLDYTTLHHLLESFGHPMTTDELDGHLAYLSEPPRGYVIREDKSAGGITVSIVRITSRGCDCVDDVRPESDPGVNINV